MDRDFKFHFTGRLESRLLENMLTNHTLFRENADKGWSHSPMSSIPHFDLVEASWITPSEIVKLAVLSRALFLSGITSTIDLPTGQELASMGVSNLSSEGMSRLLGVRKRTTGADPMEHSTLIALLRVSDHAVCRSHLTSDQLRHALRGYLVNYLNRSTEAASYFAQLFVRETIQNAKLHGCLGKKKEEWPADTFVAAYIRRSRLNEAERREKFRESVTEWELEWLLDIGEAPYIEIAVGDTGYGLVKRLGANYIQFLKKSGREVPTSQAIRDHQTIEYSYLPYSTTRSDFKSPIDLWKPRGLFLLREELRSYGGYISIRSGRSVGAWDFRSETGTFSPCDTKLSFFPGTVVTCRLALPVEDRIPRPRSVIPHHHRILQEDQEFHLLPEERLLSNPKDIEALCSRFSTFLMERQDPRKPPLVPPIIVDCVGLNDVRAISALVDVFKRFPVHTIMVGISGVPMAAAIKGRHEIEQTEDGNDEIPGILTLCNEEYYIDWVDIAQNALMVLSMLRDRKRGCGLSRQEIMEHTAIGAAQLDEIISDRRHAGLIFENAGSLTLRVGSGEIAEYILECSQRKLKERLDSALANHRRLPGVYTESDTQYRLPSGRFADAYVNVRRFILGSEEDGREILRFLYTTLARLAANIQEDKRLVIYADTYIGAWLAQEIVMRLGTLGNRVYRLSGPIESVKGSSADVAVVLTHMMSTGSHALRMCETASKYYTVSAVITVLDFREDPTKPIKLANHSVRVIAHYMRATGVSFKPLPGRSNTKIVDPVTYEFAAESKLLDFPQQRQLETWIKEDSTILNTVPSRHPNGRYNFYQLDINKLFGISYAQYKLIPTLTIEGCRRQNETFEAISGFVKTRLGNHAPHGEVILLMRSQGPVWEFKDALKDSISKCLNSPVRCFELPVHRARGNQRFGGTIFDRESCAFEDASDRLNSANVVFIDDGFISGTAIRWVQRVAASYNAARLCVVGMYSRLSYFEELSMRFVSEAFAEDVAQAPTTLKPIKVSLDCLWHLRTPAYNSFDDSPLHEVMLRYHHALQKPLTPWAYAFACAQYDLLSAARSNPPSLGSEWDESLEGKGAFKWQQVVLREDFQLQAEHVIPASTSVTTALSRMNPDLDDALITVLAFEPDLLNVGHMMSGEVNYVPLRNMCLSILRDDSRSSRFKSKALRVLWFQHHSDSGPYFDSLIEIFDALKSDDRNLQAACFYLGSTLADSISESQHFLNKIKELENHLQLQTRTYDGAKLEAWLHCRALREMYRMRRGMTKKDLSFNDFQDFCFLFLDHREWHPGSYDELLPQKIPFYGTWVHLDRLLQLLPNIKETESAVDWSHLVGHWKAITASFEQRILGRMSYVFKYLRPAIERLPVPANEIFDESMLIVQISEATSQLDQLIGEWIRWTPVERLNRINGLREIIARLQEKVFDGPQRGARPGSRLSRILLTAQTGLSEVLDRVFRQAESELHGTEDAQPGYRLVHSKLTEDNADVPQLNSFLSCVVGPNYIVQPILENMFMNVIKHGAIEGDSKSCEIVVTNMPDNMTVVELVNSVSATKNEDSAGITLIKTLAAQIGASFDHRRLGNKHVQRVTFRQGFLPPSSLSHS
jgi:hypothetical protein